MIKEIRTNRSFIMPNIGFQAQLMAFQNTGYSLDFEKDYLGFDAISEIERLLPSLLEKFKGYHGKYKLNQMDDSSSQDLFALTMHIHQCFKLMEKDKLSAQVEVIVNESIQYLRKIQVYFIKDDNSISRFDQMFKTKRSNHSIL